MSRGLLHGGATAAVIAGLALTTAAGSSAQENPFTEGVDVRSGERVFGRECSRCHGLDGTGGERGPDLTSGFQRAGTDTGLFGVVRNGVPNTEMRGIGADQNDQVVWQVVAYLRSLSGGIRVEVPGDPRAGQQVYAQNDCASCHVIEGQGGLSGPDLTTIGSRRSPEELVSDLLDPDERVQPEWWTMNVTHRDGTRIEGRRMGEGTYTVRILDEGGQMWSFEKRELTQSERIQTSPMPSYADALTDDQLEDLVAYLYGLTRPEDG